MVKIRIVTIGKIISELDIIKIKKWKSKLFLILDDITNYALNVDSDGECWSYTDMNLKRALPTSEQI